MQENEYEIVVCEMATILSRPQCVNKGVMCEHIVSECWCLDDVYWRLWASTINWAITAIPMLYMQAVLMVYTCTLPTQVSGDLL